MKIALPVDDKSLQTKVCVSFGRTPYFLIYDTDTKESKFLNNSAAQSQGGAGIKAAQEIADEGVVALITTRCGQNSADVLKLANIKIYKTINDSAEDNINAFIENKLTILDNIHPGFHNHGGTEK